MWSTNTQPITTFAHPLWCVRDAHANDMRAYLMNLLLGFRVCRNCVNMENTFLGGVQFLLHNKTHPAINVTAKRSVHFRVTERWTSCLAKLCVRLTNYPPNMLHVYDAIASPTRIRVQCQHVANTRRPDTCPTRPVLLVVPNRETRTRVCGARAHTNRMHVEGGFKSPWQIKQKINLQDGSYFVIQS